MNREIIRTMNPSILALPDVFEMFKRAFATGKLDAEWNVDTALEMGEWIASDQNGVFVGWEGEQMKGLVIGCLPTTKLLPTPAIYMFHNEGSKWLGRELAREVVDFFRDAGYNRGWVINRATPNDKIFTRWLKPVSEATPIGSIVELKF